MGGGTGGLGGIEGGGRSARWGSRVESHTTIPMGRSSRQTRGRQHQSEKHGHSLRSDGTRRSSTTSTESYANAFCFAPKVFPVAWPRNE